MKYSGNWGIKDLHVCHDDDQQDGFLAADSLRHGRSDPAPLSHTVNSYVNQYGARTNNELPEIGEGVQDGSEIRRDGVFLSRLVVGTESLDEC
jgi:hypothetical protein